MAFAGYQVNIQMDISAEKMIFGVAGVDPKRRDELIKASELSKLVKVSCILIFLMEQHPWHFSDTIFRELHFHTYRLISFHTVLC